MFQVYRGVFQGSGQCSRMWYWSTPPPEFLIGSAAHCDTSLRVSLRDTGILRHSTAKLSIKWHMKFSYSSRVSITNHRHSKCEVLNILWCLFSSFLRILFSLLDRSGWSAERVWSGSWRYSWSQCRRACLCLRRRLSGHQPNDYIQLLQRLMMFTRIFLSFVLFVVEYLYS